MRHVPALWNRRQPLLLVGPERSDLARLEAVKWIAFAAMVLDHVDLALFGRGVPWMHQVGAFAFPVFCVTFGMGVAVSRSGVQVGLRLLAPALVAQVAWAIIRPDHPASILAVFVVFAVLSHGPQSLALRIAGVVALALWSALLGEGGAATVILAAGGFAAMRLGRWWPMYAAGALWIALAPSLGALLAFAAVRFWPASWRRVPRVPGLLAWGYAGHLTLLAACLVAFW